MDIRGGDNGGRDVKLGQAKSIHIDSLSREFAFNVAVRKGSHGLFVWCLKYEQKVAHSEWLRHTELAWV
jgi:hypothetical protein